MSDDRSKMRPSLEIGDPAAKDAAEAVARFVADLQRATDADDADAYDASLAGDVMWGSPYGATLNDWEALHAIHVRMHSKPGHSPSAHSRFEIDHILTPAADVAIAQVRRVSLDASGNPVEPTFDPAKPFSEMALYVLIKRSGVWWVAAGQNTPIRPGGAAIPKKT